MRIRLRWNEFTVDVEHLVPSIGRQQSRSLPIMLPLLTSAERELEASSVDVTVNSRGPALHTRTRQAPGTASQGDPAHFARDWYDLHALQIAEAAQCRGQFLTIEDI